MNGRRRRAKLTRGVYCEGPQDKIFLSLLKEYYHTDAVCVNLKNGNGKEQEYIVLKANVALCGNDEKFVLLDDDKLVDEKDRADRRAAALGFKKVLRSKPQCIEGLMLSILEPNAKLSGLNAAQLKRKFEEDSHMQKNHRMDISAYRRVFPKDLIEERRANIPALEELIRLFY